MENFTEKREEEHAGCESTSIGVGQKGCLAWKIICVFCDSTA
jgi:hypothetical protein